MKWKLSKEKVVGDYNCCIPLVHMYVGMRERHKNVYNFKTAQTAVC